MLGRDTSGAGNVQELPISVTAAGNVTIPNNFAVTGTTGLTGNTTVTGTLGVTGATILSSTLAVTGATTLTTALGVASGGTGAATLPANNVLIGNGTSAITGVAPGTSGNVLSSNGTSWVSTTFAGSEILRVARTSNTQIGASNRSNLIDITSGTFTQTFVAAATLTSGWFCYIRNSGTGDITLDPNGAETIDGLTTYIMYPGEVRLVQCDGTALRTIVLSAFYTVFTASGTFTKPPGYTAFSGLLWGGGGSGRGGDGGSNSAGGGGGACNIFSLPSTLFSASCTVTIGAGGASVISTNGNVGGNSSFDSRVFAYGGAGGSATFSGAGGGVLSAGASSGGGPGPGSTGNSGFGGADTTNSVGLTTYAGGASGGGTNGNSIANIGGNSVYGGAGGASQGVFALPAAGGVSVFGGNGGASADAGGVAGSAPGGGGGATRINGNSSGAGARGELRLWGIV